MHEWAFSAMNAINVTLVLLFSAFPLKETALFRIISKAKNEKLEKALIG